MRHQETRKLLGTSVEIVIISDDTNTPDRISQVFDYFVSIEGEFSRFLPDSSLSQLNKFKRLTVSPRFIEVLTISKEMYHKTNGFFNPLVRVANLGYSHSFDEHRFEKTKDEIDLDFSHVSIQGDLIILGQNQSLDFGGIAKGYAVDRASDMIFGFGYEDFFVNAGGDIFAHGKNDRNEPWMIGIESPFTGEAIATIGLSDCAVATSGSYKRNWKINENRYHHLVNPYTNANENMIQSITVIASKCALSDGYTKAVFHMNVSEGIRYMEQNNLEGILFTPSGEMSFTKGMKEKYGLIFLNTPEI